MKMEMIDLHIHTIYSDGTYTPEEVVCKAKELGLVAISITDHDSVSGLEEAISAGKKLGVEVVPGVEMSTDIGEDEIHILGYYLNWKNDGFLAKLKEFQAARVERNQKLVKKLESLGMRIDYDELKGLAPQGVISRLHIARLMVKKGYVSSIGAAFEEWLNPGRPAYVEKMKVSPFEVIKLILKVGGVPVLAHPYLSKRDDLIPDLVEAGLRGIEVYHSAHSPQVSEHYLKIAQRYHLLVTGGSDCHGEAKDEVLMGKVKVPASLLAELKRNVHV
ncbi:phosphatase [Candidatus Aerophobetes bacterium]|uniref:Phosphatase n=2 Tax=Aerophobetes bacterium TaxID=2030807 RepID=A0A497E243_UNCAE|nr:MAG: phosphatase [Candidatus Aerophobetes bacterium]